jgi:hypothetical protein
VLCRRRVILMAWWAWGRSRFWTWVVFRVRVSLRGVAGLAAGGGGGDLAPGQGLDPGVQQRLVGLDHGDVVGVVDGD